MRSKLAVSVYFFLALYGSTTVQSRLFIKNIKNFVWFPKQYLLGFFILEKQLANIPDRGFLFLHNTLLLYIPLLALTHGRNYRETNTLASRGLEEPAHALRGLEEPFFQLCFCFSFLFWREIGFGFTYYLCTWSTIQLWCCVSFFGSGEK